MGGGAGAARRTVNGAPVDAEGLRAAMRQARPGEWELTGPATRRRPDLPGSVSFMVRARAGSPCGPEPRGREGAPFFARVTARDPADATNGVAFERAGLGSWDEALAWAAGRIARIPDWRAAQREGGLVEW